MNALRLAVRALRATPVVTTVVILSLALGIGANTAIFSLVNGLLLRSLPVPNADRLVTLTVGNTEQRFTYATFDELRRHGHLFDGALAWAESALAIGEEAEPAYVQWVSGDFFDTLGVRAFVGRTLTPADDVARGGPAGPVAVISHGLWQPRFGGASDVIGRSLLVEGEAVTVGRRIPDRAVRGRERGQGRVGPASTLCSATRDATRGGVSGAARSLHEHRQHFAGTRRRAPPLPEPAGCARRIALAARSAVPDRERSAVPARRRLR